MGYCPLASEGQKRRVGQASKTCKSVGMETGEDWETNRVTVHDGGQRSTKGAKISVEYWRVATTASLTTENGH